MVSAVLDESALFVARDDEVQDELIRLGKFLERLRSDGLNLQKKSVIWEAPVSGTTPLYELLFVPGKLDADLQSLLKIQIEKLESWDVNEQEISSRQYVNEGLGRREAWACIVLAQHCNKIRTEGAPTLHLIGTVPQAIDYYRDAVELGDFNENSFIANCGRAFPGLFIRQGIEAQIGSFTEAFRPHMRIKLVKALADLNDLIPKLVAEHRDIPTLIGHFNAASEFEISPESPRTHKNVAAMRERDADFGVKIIRCEWHLKISPERDRIHFHFGDNEVAKEKILVGLFCEHLTT